ncbi:MAG: DUF3014 domain-containing protein [Pseudomonadota bacterium]
MTARDPSDMVTTEDAMNSNARVAIIAVFAALAAAVVGGAIWWSRQPPKPPPVRPTTAQTPAPPARPIAVPPPVAPTIKHPIAPQAPQSKGELPPLAESDPFIKRALLDLLGRKAVLDFLRVDDFARRFVATVDNLASDHASASLWPVNPAAGPFQTTGTADAASTTIAAENAGRHAATVAFLEAIDTRAAVALYKRLYPLFQRMYEDLGYPGQYFNDRVVQVIDDLLATPEVAAPIKVRLIQVEGQGAVKPASGASGLYVFEDASLERLPAGQKILLRVGQRNAARLKAKLADVRGQIATGAAVPRDRE